MLGKSQGKEQSINESHKDEMVEHREEMAHVRILLEGKDPAGLSLLTWSLGA